MKYEKYFTETTDGLDVSANNLSANCITSKNNKFGIDTEGNLTCNSITTNVQTGGITLDQLYPVGSIYMSVAAINPTNLFGGKWEQIKDCFLVASGSTYVLGKTGGSATHIHSQGVTGKASGNTGSTTLTVEQIPSHDHVSFGYTSVSVSQTNPSSSIPGSFALGIGFANDVNGWWSDRYKLEDWAGKNKGGGQGHTHTLNNHTHNNPNTNSSSNIPPYLAVNVWKRVS